MYPSSNLWVPMLAVFWWRCCWRCCWRWRCCWMCCCLIRVSYVPIVITHIWILCFRARCATHWNIAFSSCLIFCKLLRTNERFVYNILSNIMIRQSSSTMFCFFACFFGCLFVCFYILFFLNNSKYVKTNIFMHHD